MKRLLLPFLALCFLVACSSNSESSSSSEQQKTSTTPPKKETKPKVTTDSSIPASERVELDNKGVGPITSVELTPEVNQSLAKDGEKVFTTNCTLCHKIDEQYIGPPMKGILDRRSPEWVMNMILKPELMVRQDPLAKDLLKEYNNSPMTNQNMTEEQARAMLEYFRTL